MSPPPESRAARRLVHTRRITCEGYQRDDDLWDIEARVVDTRTESLPLLRGGLLPAGKPLHELGLRLTIDEDMLIRRAEAFTAAGPTPACGEVDTAYKALEGLRIGPGFLARARALLGGIKGCTHLTELLGPLGTTAFQALWPTLEQRHRERMRSGEPGEDPHAPLIDGCHAYRRDGDVVQIMSERYRAALRSAPAPRAETD